MSSKRSRNKNGRPAAPQTRKPAPVAAAKPAAPVEEGGNPNLILGAVIVVALFLAWYYHLSAMGQMKDLVGGITMLDHHPFGYDAATVDHLRGAMNDDARGQLSWVHKTAGTLFSLFAAFATALAIGLHAPKKPWRRALYALPIAFAIVAIIQNIVVDQLLGASNNSLLPLANGLTIASWILLGLCIVATIGFPVSAFIREFKRRWNDPSLQDA